MTAPSSDFNLQPPNLPVSTDEPIKGTELSFEIEVSKITQKEMTAVTNIETDAPYNPELEIAKRRANLEKACAGRRRGIMRVNFRSGLVSRFGVSRGGIPFWTCFMPKSASSSLSVTSFKDDYVGLKSNFWLEREIRTNFPI